MQNNRSFKRNDILFYSGIILVIVSVSFFLVLFAYQKSINIDCVNTASNLEEMIPGREVGIKEERSNNEMPCISYDGMDYVALLSVPEYAVYLPVRSSWNAEYMKKVPCRFGGNPYQGTLVIGGYDSEGQFDFLSKLYDDDMITVTDMTGAVFTYFVSAVRHSDNANADTLMDSNYDLSLFVKDRKYGVWILVRCTMKQ